MFEKNALVVYGKTGVCRVADKRMMSFGGAEVEYYVLHPYRDPSSSVYVPCDNEQLTARLRALLTKGEIDALLRGVQCNEVVWVEDKNERATLFRAILSEGDRSRLICMVRCLLSEQHARAASGKRLSSADEAILKDCVRLIEEEFSVALGIASEEVGAYIRSALEVD